MKPVLPVRLGMAEARLKLPEIAAQLASSPESVVVVTRRGKPVLHLVAPLAMQEHATAAQRILQRLARMKREEPRRRRRTKNVARRTKELLYGR